MWLVRTGLLRVPSQVWRQFWSFPRTRPRRASLQSQNRQTPGRCWRTPHSQLRSSAVRTEARYNGWLHMHLHENNDAFLTIRFALQMWCLISPPPRMIIPVLLANTAWLFILRMSEEKSTFKRRPNRLKADNTASSSYVILISHPPLCPKPSRGSWKSGSRSCLPESRRSEQDWRLECCSAERHNKTFTPGWTN